MAEEKIYYELIDYKESFGALNLPEGFEDALRGKPVEEQLKCYAWSKDRVVGEADGVSYRDLEAYCRSHPKELARLSPVKAGLLIMRDGVVVGVTYYAPVADDPSDPNTLYHFSRNSVKCVLPYARHCYDVLSDNNGAGYKETCLYEYLICLPYGHTLWE